MMKTCWLMLDLYFEIMNCSLFSMSVPTLRLIFLKEGVVSCKLEYSFHGAQDQWVNITIKADLWTVVPHREDAVHWNTHVHTELFHLHLKVTTSQERN